MRAFSLAFSASAFAISLGLLLLPVRETRGTAFLGAPSDDDPDDDDVLGVEVFTPLLGHKAGFNIGGAAGLDPYERVGPL